MSAWNHGSKLLKTSYPKVLTMPSKQFSTIKLNNKRKVFGCSHSGSVMGFSLPVFSDIDSLSALFPFFFFYLVWLLPQKARQIIREKDLSLMVASFLSAGKEISFLLHCLLAIIESCIGCVFSFLKYNNHVLDVHQNSQQNQLNICVSRDCIGRSDKWKELALSFFSSYVLLLLYSKQKSGQES